MPRVPGNGVNIFHIGVASHGELYPKKILKFPIASYVEFSSKVLIYRNSLAMLVKMPVFRGEDE